MRCEPIQINGYVVIVWMKNNFYLFKTILNMVQINAYWTPERETTFWSDFTIADKFWTSAVKDTFQRAFDEWKSNYKYLTELVMVLNWKLREHYDKWDKALAKVYESLWMQADEYAVDNLKDDELSYFLNTTD